MDFTERSPFRRVGRGELCPVCGKPDWCMVAGPQSSPTAAICARVESPQRIGRNGKHAGWLHRLRDDDRHRLATRTIRFGEPARTQPAPDLTALARRYSDAVKPDHLAGFAASLGVSSESLRRMGIGWAGDKCAWAFPMVDPAGRVLGIRLRAASGNKFAVRGGGEGLFLPAGDATGERLLICEGPTDCASLLDIDLPAVGRPSCTGGVGLLAELVKRRRPAEVVIVADADAPGLRGAETLAAVLLAYSAAVRIITPPAGVKDARAWRQAGATAADVLAVIAAAPVRKLTIKAERKGERS